jgi:ATP-dependent Clp protease ATP-binding subunit ClpB
MLSARPCWQGCQVAAQLVQRSKTGQRPCVNGRGWQQINNKGLQNSAARRIVDIQFEQIQQRLHEAGIALEATDEVLDYLGEQGFDPQFGARPLKRVIQRVILNELSKEILSGKVSKDAVVEAVLENGEVHFENVELPIV